MEPDLDLLLEYLLGLECRDRDLLRERDRDRDLEAAGLGEPDREPGLDLRGGEGDRLCELITLSLLRLRKMLLRVMLLRSARKYTVTVSF